MKINRTKRAQKHLQFYSNNFGFREPYQVIVDGTFCLQALKHQLQIAHQIQKYLQVEVKLVTTACVIIESESLGSKFIATTKALKALKVHKCGHEKNPLTGSACLKFMCKQSHYIVATQDRELQEQLRRKVGVPLMYLHNAAPTLEPPSDESNRVAIKRAKGAVGISQTEAERLKVLKEKEGIVEPVVPRIRRPKKKGGPNPLSCKKKKAKPGSESTKGTPKIKSGQVEKKKKRVKLSKNVKDLLKNEIKTSER